jgi:hypothetical protein
MVAEDERSSAAEEPSAAPTVFHHGDYQPLAGASNSTHAGICHFLPEEIERVLALPQRKGEVWQVIVTPLSSQLLAPFPAPFGATGAAEGEKPCVRLHPYLILVGSLYPVGQMLAYRLAAPLIPAPLFTSPLLSSVDIPPGLDLKATPREIIDTLLKAMFDPILGERPASRPDILVFGEQRTGEALVSSLTPVGIQASGLTPGEGFYEFAEKIGEELVKRGVLEAARPSVGRPVMAGWRREGNRLDGTTVQESNPHVGKREERKGADFFRAAAAFARTLPWNVFPSRQCLRMNLQTIGRPARTIWACVLGDCAQEATTGERGGEGRGEDDTTRGLLITTTRYDMERRLITASNVAPATSPLDSICGNPGCKAIGREAIQGIAAAHIAPPSIASSISASEPNITHIYTPETGMREREAASSINRCTGCHSAFYCSVDCQRTAWPTHKKECKAAAAAFKGCSKPGSGGSKEIEWWPTHESVVMFEQPGDIPPQDDEFILRYAHT